MARSRPHTLDAPSSPTPSATTSGRIAKARPEASSSRTTRQQSRATLSSVSIGALESMVNEAQEVTLGASVSGSKKDKGKSKETVPDFEEAMDVDDQHLPSEQKDVCPITDKDEKPFPIMELPTEIRLEIYRACLTRPYTILLSKKEQPIVLEPETSVAEDGNGLVMWDSDDEAEDDSRNTRPRPARQQRASYTSDTITPRRTTRAIGLRGLASRGARPIRLFTSRPVPASTAGLGVGSNSTNATYAANPTNVTNNNSSNRQMTRTVATSASFRTGSSRPPRRTAGANGRTLLTPSEPPRNQTADPLLVNILRASKEIYKEARSVLYSENFFNLDLNTALPTLDRLHQRSRRQIKHVELEIPTYNEILERFQETVRLSLRYCSGLKKLVIHMPFTLPGSDGSSTTGNTTVYANGFDILRWLPQECNILLKGNVCTEIETVVNKHLQLAKTLDKVRHATIQYRMIIPEEYEEWMQAHDEKVKARETALHFQP